ncbi:MAG: Similar to citrate lyase beta chain, 2 [uncultured Rubrobacteraceae bacterium]|uniref:Similar to citrate lyase beta chain, 2 n=1 Tax=uncultured Rubrobacteraceae bacterium TaxID=349277 RepID=A0A6J4R3B4_9ACTN|nr:MAG: Similar to citrate lyase beta chain, 2 [uncultured Rubrobacteraceae bacterium]
MRISRSVLAVPASKWKMVERGPSSGADLFFLDLEDAVAPNEKAAARENVVRAINELDWSGPTFYRMNSLETPYWYRDIIEVVEEAGEGLDLILVPKVERPEDLHTLDTLLQSVETNAGLEPGKVKLEAQIETAKGLANIDAIAHATDRLEALVFGPGDYAASVRMPQTSIGTMDEWDEVYPGHRFHYAMHRIVVAARAADLRAIDGPVADYRDEEGLRKSCLVARSLGFDGKWCIHPGQVEIVNEVFSPTERELEWADKVVSAYEEANAAGSGSISVDGQMVDAASIKMARNTLELARGPETA